MATGPSGPVGPGAGIPFSTEWLQAKKKQLKKAGLADATDTEAQDVSTLSKHAQKLAKAESKDQKMLTQMRAELANLDTESETFLQDATEKLIDSVIEQEYGESFKEKPGYGNLQGKLTRTVLENPSSREALTDFFELLLMIEEPEDEFEDEEESEGEEGEPEHAEEFEEEFEDEEEE